MSMPRYVHAYAGSIVASPATTLFSEFRNNGERMTKVRKNDETEKSIEVASVGETRDESGNVWNAVNYRQRRSSDNHLIIGRSRILFPVLRASSDAYRPNDPSWSLFEASGASPRWLSFLPNIPPPEFPIYSCYVCLISRSPWVCTCSSKMLQSRTSAPYRGFLSCRWSSSSRYIA